jgi:hypothetical protein
MAKEEIRARISTTSELERSLYAQEQTALATCVSYTNLGRALRTQEIEAFNAANLEYHRIHCEHVNLMMDIHFWNTQLTVDT